MVNSFPRIVIGHVIASCLTLSGNVAPGSSVSWSHSGKHGELVGWDIVNMNGSTIDFTNINLKLTIDDVIVYDDRQYAFYGGILFGNLHTKFATCDVLGTYWSKCSFKLVLPFDDSYGIVFSNSGGSGNLCYVNLYERIGS